MLMFKKMNDEKEVINAAKMLKNGKAAVKYRNITIWMWFLCRIVVWLV